jgi:predicted outer membrane repeat protein
VQARTVFRLAIGAALAAGLALPSPAAADTYHVSCSAPQLADAINQANAHPGRDTIVLSSTCEYALTTDLPAITDSLDIVGGSNTTLSTNGSAHRVFDIAASTSVNVQNVFLRRRGGSVPSTGGLVRNDGALVLFRDTLAASGPVGAESGGAIANSGQLTMRNDRLTGNLAAGDSASGGAIASSGTLRLVSPNVLTSNSAKGPEASGGAIASSGTLVLEGIGNSLTNNVVAGREASGGAIASSATATVTDAAFTSNVAQGDPATGPAGGSVRGGAISNTGTFAITEGVVAANRATGTEGQDAFGGAIANAGTMTIVGTVVNTNAARAGDTPLSDGRSAVGGAVANTGDLSLSRVPLISNSAQGGGAQEEGGVGLGGAIYNSHTGRFHVANSTLTKNSASSKGPHAEAQAFGGGIASESDSRPNNTVLASTLARNSAGTGSNLANASPTLTLQDTIVTDGQSGQNCGRLPQSPRFVGASLGYNIDSGSSCGLNGNGDKSETDPELRPLTGTYIPIGLSSPALDQGVSGGLTTDQLGQKRPVIVPGVPRPAGGDGSDIGAYEYQPSQAGHSRITGSVRPGRAQVGERTCFKFNAKKRTGGAMKKVQVRFAGKRARTNRRGRATICERFRDPGVRHPRLRKRGHERARLRVNVRP